MASLKKLVVSNRSCRRYDSSYIVPIDSMHQLIELARLCPSARNIQPLKYYLSNNADTNSKIFSCLHWAGSLKEGGISISENERPTAYIVILGDRLISPSYGCDHGIVAQTILLGAREIGLAGCIIGSVDAENLRNYLNLSVQYDILLVVALGKPAEFPVIENLSEYGSYQYWRDEKGIHHVPKRSLDELIIGR